MKKVSRLLALVLAMSLLLVGCGKKVSEDTSLQDITSKGKFVLGLDASFPPMGFKDDNENIVGFDIDVATEVAKRMDVELVLQPIDWNAKDQELKTKNIDCIWNGFTKNDEREKNYTLSATYMKNTQVAVVKADSNVNTLADLSGKVVEIQKGSSASDAIDANKEFKDSLKELVLIGDNVKALLDLGLGCDAVVMDEVVARYYTELKPGEYKVLEESLSDEEYVIGFRKNDKLLCAEVEKHLKDMAADGTLAAISTEWFGKDITTIK